MYKRILLKVSGESLLGDERLGINRDACQRLAETIYVAQQQGVQMAVVIGGGNLFRGIQAKEMGLARTPADQMGMLATMMNAIAMQQALTAIGCPARVMTALECPRVAETYQWQNAQKYLESGEVLLFAGGTGNPYFTTDTAAALRACEMGADALFKATKVEGVYDRDPLKFSDAIKYETISYSQVLAEKLEVMDATSIAMCRQHKIPILVFHMNLWNKKDVLHLINRQHIGTLIQGE